MSTEPSAYGQSLASVLNNPRLGKAGIYSSDGSWGSWLFQGSSDPLLDVSPPPLPSGTLPEVFKSHFQSYLDSIFESYGRFVDVRDHSSWEQNNQGSVAAGDGSEGEGRAGQGEGLVVCLREIPSLYFDEDFSLENGSTFQAACPFSSIPQNRMLQEKLSHYLDLVEVQLVREISARSDSFFDALGELEDLNARIVQACEQIRELQGTVKLLEGDLIDSASRIQSLGVRRNSFIELHQKLKLVAYVNQALSALRLLVAAADCAGALDIIDDLQHMLEGDELIGLHCFRRLGNQLVSAMDSVNSTLAADFVRAAIHHTGDLESSSVITLFHARVKSYPNFAIDLISIEADHDEGDESGLRDQLLPIVIGLLRTSKLPAVLRVYRDTLITDIKAAIKTVVAELIPILFTRPPDGDLPSADRQADMEVGGLSLAYKMRALSAENFVRLLVAVFGTVQARLLRAGEVRSVIEQIIGGLQGSYAAAAVAAAFASGAAAAAAAEAAQEAEQSSFEAEALTASNISGTSKKGVGMANSNISRQFRADVLRENTEAVCAACDAAHGRWAKLLGVRALIHPKLRLQEFVSIYNITQDFISATEKVGGRLGYSLRGALQSQSKSFVDNQHSTRMAKISAVLEQETWVEVDAPDEFQAIVDSFVELVPSNCNSTFDEGIPAELASSCACQNDDQGTLLIKDSDAIMDHANGLPVIQKEIHDIPRKDDVATSPPDFSKDGALTELIGRLSSSNGMKQKPNSQKEDGDLGANFAAAKSKKGREKPSVKGLQVRGISYHCVNCGLILLKMISEYMDITNALPSLATEVVHRVAEILKVYNSCTCQLVLGAGALKVSGLKSITAKHLALSSQSISFFYSIMPDIRRLLSLDIPEARKALLLMEIDRVGQDYIVHQDEIHSKLVQIMKERLLVHLKTAQTVENWNKLDDSDTQPSLFARTLTKEVGVLHRVLSPLLLEADLRSIFTRVVILFHSQIAEIFSKLDASTPHGKQRLYRDIQHILSCIRGLPSDDIQTDGTHTPRELDEFLQQRFGPENLS